MKTTLHVHIRIGSAILSFIKTITCHIELRHGMDINLSINGWNDDNSEVELAWLELDGDQMSQGVVLKSIYVTHDDDNTPETVINDFVESGWTLNRGGKQE